MQKLILYIILLLACCGAAMAQKTALRKLRPIPAEAPRAAPDSVVGLSADSLVTFSGYEKTLRASRETLFITSHADRPICRISFTISYFDNIGRMLHSRRQDMSVDVPSGETRRIDFPTWDTQRTTYFSGGPRPRNGGIPYTVSISNPTIYFEPNAATTD